MARGMCRCVSSRRSWLWLQLRGWGYGVLVRYRRKPRLSYRASSWLVIHIGIMQSRDSLLMLSRCPKQRLPSSLSVVYFAQLQESLQTAFSSARAARADSVAPSPVQGCVFREATAAQRADRPRAMNHCGIPSERVRETNVWGYLAKRCRGMPGTWVAAVRLLLLSA